MAFPKHHQVLADYSALAGYRDHPIHVAQGLLMERHKVTARAALGLLRQQAAARRLSLIEMAQWLLKTRLPSEIGVRE